MSFYSSLKPEKILKSTGLTDALKKHWKYSSVWAVVFLISNLLALLFLGFSLSYIIEYLAAGLVILLIGIPVIELTKAALLWILWRISGDLKSSYEKMAVSTLYACFPMVIFYPLIAVVFINLLISPVSASTNLLLNFLHQLVLLSGIRLFIIPITLIPVLWKLAVCTGTLSKRQKSGLGKSFVISLAALVLVVLVFGLPYSYLTTLIAH